MDKQTKEAILEAGKIVEYKAKQVSLEIIGMMQLLNSLPENEAIEPIMSHEQIAKRLIDEYISQREYPLPTDGEIALELVKEWLDKETND